MVDTMDLTPADWWRESALLEDLVRVWDNSLLAVETGLRDVIADLAGQVYGLNEHDADMCFEMLNTPMEAPSFRVAAFGVLQIDAVQESGITMHGVHAVMRNRTWWDDECWCWRAPEVNPRCPRHVWRDSIRAAEGDPVRREHGPQFGTRVED
jgi:hypothetical protein